MKMCKFIFFVTILCGVTANVAATDLMDVYKKALVSDPTFKAASAQWLADKERLPISRAALLPQLSATGDVARNRREGENGTDINTVLNNHYYNTTSGYSLKLTQSIFNFANWATVWGAQALVKSAEATFLAAEEDLLQRTSTAYFNVLQAKDVLSYAKSKKAESERLYIQTKRKYEVGLLAIVDYEDSRKNYYKSISDELQAVNDLNNQFENLAVITGVRYYNLDPVKANFPLLSPNPSDIEAWVKAAKQQNFNLMAARYNSIAARENIKVQNAGHLPTLTAKGNYDYLYDNNYGGYNTFNRTKNASADLSLTVPIFQGGGVVAAAKQADYQYQNKLATQEYTYRYVISQTRQTYLGILTNISKIKADIQAIIASKSSLRAMEANYSVGTRTMADVLQAQSNLYDAQKTFAADEYNYIKQLLALKALTAILTADDLAQINSWLESKSSATKTKATTKQTTKKGKKNKAKTSNKCGVTIKNKPKVAQPTEVTNSAQAAEPTTPLDPTAAANNAIAETPATTKPTESTSAVANNTNGDNSKIVVLDTEEVKQIAPAKN